MKVGETVQNTLKGGGAEKRSGKTKSLKRGDKLGQGLGALKRGGGGWNPLTNYVLSENTLNLSFIRVIKKLIL